MNDKVFEQINEAIALFLNIEESSRASVVDLLKSVDKSHDQPRHHSEIEI